MDCAKRRTRRLRASPCNGHRGGGDRPGGRGVWCVRSALRTFACRSRSRSYRPSGGRSWPGCGPVGPAHPPSTRARARANRSYSPSRPSASSFADGAQSRSTRSRRGTAASRCEAGGFDCGHHRFREGDGQVKTSPAIIEDLDRYIEKYNSRSSPPPPPTSFCAPRSARGCQGGLRDPRAGLHVVVGAPAARAPDHRPSATGPRRGAAAYVYCGRPAHFRLVLTGDARAEGGDQEGRRARAWPARPGGGGPSLLTMGAAVSKSGARTSHGFSRVCTVFFLVRVAVSLSDVAQKCLVT